MIFENLTETSNIDIYAKWTENPIINITIHPQNGEENIVWKDGDAVPVLTKEGYTFDGWYFDEDYSQEVAADYFENFTATADDDVYAKWTENQSDSVTIKGSVIVEKNDGAASAASERDETIVAMIYVNDEFYCNVATDGNYVVVAARADVVTCKIYYHGRWHWCHHKHHCGGHHGSGEEEEIDYDEDGNKIFDFVFDTYLVSGTLNYANYSVYGDMYINGTYFSDVIRGKPFSVYVIEGDELKFEGSGPHIELSKSLGNVTEAKPNIVIDLFEEKDEEKAFTISGKLQLDGNPYIGAAIVEFSPTGEELNKTRTDADGTYTLHAAAGNKVAVAIQTDNNSFSWCNLIDAVYADSDDCDQHFVSVTPKMNIGNSNGYFYVSSSAMKYGIRLRDGFKDKIYLPLNSTIYAYPDLGNYVNSYTISNDVLPSADYAQTVAADKHEYTFDYSDYRTINITVSGCRMDGYGTSSVTKGDIISVGDTSYTYDFYVDYYNNFGINKVAASVDIPLAADKRDYVLDFATETLSVSYNGVAVTAYGAVKITSDTFENVSLLSSGKWYALDGETITATVNGRSASFLRNADGTLITSVNITDDENVAVIPSVKLCGNEMTADITISSGSEVLTPIGKVYFAPKNSLLTVSYGLGDNAISAELNVGNGGLKTVDLVAETTYEGTVKYNGKGVPASITCAYGTFITNIDGTFEIPVEADDTIKINLLINTGYESSPLKTSFAYADAPSEINIIGTVDIVYGTSSLTSGETGVYVGKTNSLGQIHAAGGLYCCVLGDGMTYHNRKLTTDALTAHSVRYDLEYVTVSLNAVENGEQIIFGYYINEQYSEVAWINENQCIYSSTTATVLKGASIKGFKSKAVNGENYCHRASAPVVATAEGDEYTFEFIKSIVKGKFTVNGKVVCSALDSSLQNVMVAVNAKDGSFEVCAYIGDTFEISFSISVDVGGERKTKVYTVYKGTLAEDTDIGVKNITIDGLIFVSGKVRVNGVGVTCTVMNMTSELIAITHSDGTFTLCGFEGDVVSFMPYMGYDDGISSSNYINIPAADTANIAVNITMEGEWAHVSGQLSNSTSFAPLGVYYDGQWLEYYVGYSDEYNILVPKGTTLKISEASGADDGYNHLQSYVITEDCVGRDFDMARE